MPFHDIDDAVESNAGRSIADIFATDGEPAFRDLESQQLERLVASDTAAVIALGGGTILRASNRELIRGGGVVVWLQAAPETIQERIANDAGSHLRRPKLSKLGDLDEIRKILEHRTPWYREMASLTVETDGLNAESIADTIVTWVRSGS